MAPFPLLFFLDLCYKSRLFKVTFLQEIFPVPLSSGFGAHPNLTYFTVYYHIVSILYIFTVYCIYCQYIIYLVRHFTTLLPTQTHRHNKHTHTLKVL